MPDEGGDTLRINRVPPHSVLLQRAGDDDTIDDVEQCADIVHRLATANHDRQLSGFLARFCVLQRGGAAGALPGRDEHIGVEKFRVTGQLPDGSVSDDRVGACFTWTSAKIRKSDCRNQAR